MLRIRINLLLHRGHEVALCRRGAVGTTHGSGNYICADKVSIGVGTSVCFSFRFGPGWGLCFELKISQKGYIVILYVYII